MGGAPQRIAQPDEPLPRLLAGAERGSEQIGGVDYVPLALRHGPRELAHMRHLGLIADPAEKKSSTEATDVGSSDQKKPTEVAGMNGAGAPAAASSQTQCDNYVPIALRHGPRELAHMRHLGLITD